jgi:diguanylate cyclase (GGDEF)-like protein
MLPRAKILESLLELSGRTTRSRPELIERALEAALQLVEADGAVVLATHQRRIERVSRRRSDPAPQFLTSPKGGSEFARMLLRSATTLATPDLADDGRVGSDDACPGVEAGPAVFVPVRQREHGFGYLAVFRARGGPRFDSEDVRLLMLMAGWLAMALENMRLAENLEKLAVTDDLTQVYNYRFLKTALRREIKRAGRFAQELSLIMVDVDNLKAYNDRHGHLRGSFLLKEIAGLFSQQVRSWDLVAKYGGDEFTVILPQTGGEGAMVVAERLRAAVEQHAFPLARAGQITVSLGVARFPQEAGDAPGLIQAADRALYVAKQAGRNRVEALWTLAA